MRIGILTQSYLPIHGGVAEHVHHTAEELRRRGHTVKVITAFFNRGDENYSDNVIRIGRDLTLPKNGAFVNITVGARLGRDLRRIEIEEGFDLVHIHAPLEPFLPLIGLHNLQCPKVGTFHSYAEQSLGYAVFAPVWRRYANRLAARIAVSESARDFIARYFPGEYHVIPNGVDVERFSRDVEPLEKFADGAENILFVGRMDPRKGLKYLLQAFHLVHQSRPNARLIVVGGGFLAGYYKGFVKEAEKDRVVFTGYASARDLPRYYASADVFCSPATASESFGIVLIEAMASGAPVVAFDNRGYRAVLGGDKPGGVLVQNKSVPALAATLIDLLRHKEKLAQFGRQGRDIALRYSWRNVIDEVEKVYEKVLRP